MADFACFYETNLPDVLVDEICAYGEKLELHRSKLFPTPSANTVNQITKEPWRNSENGFINLRDCWIGPFIWQYVEHANLVNFRYDISCLDAENVQYTSYSAGMYYHWHQDHHISMSSKPDVVRCASSAAAAAEAHVNAEYSRKLSFSLQLSHEDEYDGGELQFLSSEGLFTAKKNRGKLVIFDSRTSHRVRRVKSGTRKSLVGWAVGPRWR